MGSSKDVQPRTRKAASSAEVAARSNSIAKKAAEKEKKAAAATAAARATFQASLLGGSRPRASGAGSSSQDNGHAEAASDSTEPSMLAQPHSLGGSSHAEAAAAGDGDGAVGPASHQERL